MWLLKVLSLTLVAVVISAQNSSPKSGEELVTKVMDNCSEMSCVKENVLSYLDNVLNVQENGRSLKSIDNVIYKRVAKVLKTHELRLRLPEVIFGKVDMVYNPKSGLDLISEDQNESRGMLLKKKLLFPLLLLFKLKSKILTPILLAIIKFKAIKALIISKLSLAIVLGFVAYQLLSKSGMPMPVSMAPVEPPTPIYGPPSSSPPASSPSSGNGAPNSYEPQWEPNSGGPYARIWNSASLGSTSSNENNGGQSLAYSAYYPGSSSSTVNP